MNANHPLPPIEKNIHEAKIELLLESIQIAIEEMPIPISEKNDRRLQATVEKLREAIAILVPEVR